MSKTKVATLLCVCYVAVLLRPVVPMFEDVLAHMLWESEHIATVHFEDGKYHVHVEIKDAAEDSENHQAKSGETSGETTVHFVQSATAIEIPLEENVRLVEHTRHCPVRDGYFSVQTQPPRLN